ncbi:5-carboxymethyl-2-hydroxymuconate Delta-isomerase [Amphritea sp. HPY]|uniref:5-carboxymethyl-2-hydroxymuconate Delta-isomerase n=1 Tax=Amphritea sp. HPY TaxID=3421652 RepID=UPI003D7CCE3B
MPHCIIEYAKGLEDSLDISTLVATVHTGAFRTGLFAEADIKTRAIAYEYFQTGSTDTPFIHVTVRILSGRTRQQKSLLTRQILAQLRQLQNLQKIQQGSALSLTVEVLDIERETYAKAID